MKQRVTQKIWFDILLLAIGLGIFYALFLGSYALVAPDEARYAEIAREMLVSGHFITPHLNGVIYLEKPILFYWLEALSIKLFGLSEWSVRFWPACLAILGALFTYFTGRKVYGRKTGLYAAIILTTSILYFTVGHLITLDMAVAVFITVCLGCFLLGTRATTSGSRRTYIWLAAISAALAVLTKGLIGFVFPCMIIGLWVVLLNKWRSLKDWHLPSAILIFLVIVLPWHILVQHQNPDFFHFYFIQQQFLRYSTMSASRYEPSYFYFAETLIGFMPWSVFLLQALKFNWPNFKHWKRYETEIFFLLWVFSILLFFSFSNSKLIPYITPIFPALALLTARYFSQYTILANIKWLRTKRKLFVPGINIGFILLPLLTLLIGIVLIKLPHYYPMAEPKWAHRFLIILAIILFGSTLIATALYRKKGIQSAFICLSIGMAIFLVTLLCAVPHMDHRSIKPLAQKLNQVIKPSDEVATYSRYYQDLPYYLRRRVTVVDWINELKFGIEHQDASAWIIKKPKFWKRWNSHRRVFMVTRRDDYTHLKKQYPLKKFYVLGRTERNILLCNQEITQ